jgi:hypothetical protein
MKPAACKTWLMFRFEIAPAKASSAWHPVVLAYRQAEMFVTYLHDSDGPAFASMWRACHPGRGMRTPTAAC